ncbi:hypothetical protein GGH13_001582 [Coemansia sp. S155-1]|nr:hypothetical protein GGH13_001582 [Coemansia sp. S155-1]
MAVVKTGCLSDPDLYLNYFGIADIGDGLKTFLDKVRRFLFSADGIFVGGKLVDSGFERSERPELAKIFLFEKAFAAAYPEDVKPACEVSVDSGAVRPASFSFASCAHLFPPTTKTSATSVPATAPAAPSPGCFNRHDDSINFRSSDSRSYGPSDFSSYCSSCICGSCRAYYQSNILSRT